MGNIEGLLKIFLLQLKVGNYNFNHLQNFASEMLKCSQNFVGIWYNARNPGRIGGLIGNMKTTKLNYA